MLEYGQVFPQSIPAIWERNSVLSQLYNYATSCYYGLTARRLTRPLRRLSPDCIPVVIVNFNRLETLMVMVDWLNSLMPAPQVIILDNCSTYAPLLRYYEQINGTEADVIYLNDNTGIRSTLRLARALRRFRHYIITDSDLLPYATTPPDILQKMAAVLDAYPAHNHVGASLELDDIPAHYPFKDVVAAWETQYWSTMLGPDVYEADVDTTFAMYRGHSNLRKRGPALRLARPYTLKHADWYINPADISEEYAYYLNTCSPQATWTTKLKSYVNELDPDRLKRTEYHAVSH